MAPLLSRIDLFCVVLVSLLPTYALAEKLADIPAVKYRVTEQAISPVRLSDVPAGEIVINNGVALINSRRAIHLLAAGGKRLQQVRLATIGVGSPWYGVSCAINDGFAIALQDYPDEQREVENGTPRGGFRSGPVAKGFAIVGTRSSDRVVASLTISSRPSAYTDDVDRGTVSNTFAGHVQSCSWDGRKLLVGSYGSLGKIDLEKAEIDLIEDDDGLAYSRFPLLVEPSVTYVGYDEGGMGGASLVRMPTVGSLSSYSIATDEDFDVVSFSALVRHRGKLFVGTSHGLFALEETAGNFVRIDLGERLSRMPVTTLLSHRGYLWVFMGDEWLRVDTPGLKAVIYSGPAAGKLITGRPFDKGWLLAGPSGVWKLDAAKAGNRATRRVAPDAGAMQRSRRHSRPVRPI